MDASRSLEPQEGGRRCLWHPFELAFSGFSGSGKTTLLERVVRRLAETFRVGYLKHDAHGFEMDQPGKDTWRLREAGASLVQITSPRAHALVSSLETSADEQLGYFQGCDFVLVEGYKNSVLPKVAVLDREGRLEQSIRAGEFANVVAYAFPDEDPGTLGAMPRFHRDDLESAASFVEGFLTQRARATPLFGLILAGGESRRMGEDKALLAYHGRSQVAYLADLLAPLCTATYVSRRPDQGEIPEGNRGIPILFDTFLEMGPMGGVLSALRAFPHAAWLVVACDLPWLDSAALEALVAARNPFRQATAFLQSDGAPEPLCTIYEPRIYRVALGRLAEGRTSLRSLLRSDVSTLLEPPCPEALRSLDTPQEFSRFETGAQALPPEQHE